MNTEPEVPPEAGEYGPCEPQEDSPYIYHPDHYVEFLKSLKPHPSQLFIGAVVAPPAPVEVTMRTEDWPWLEAACSGPSGEAAPGVRFQYFLDAFPGQSAFLSICSGTLSEQWSEMTAALREAFYNPQCIQPRS